MAHMMGANDKALAVREPMWHGLEDLLEEAPTRQQAEALVHDYTVGREPLYRKVDDGDINHYELVDDYELNVRLDTNEVFDMVPKERVDPQPTEVWDVAEQVMNTSGFGNIVVETAGTHSGGRHMYILMKLDQIIKIKGDHYGDSIAYFAIQNAYVRGFALRFQPTNVRIQCANTSSAADFSAEAAGLNLSLAHTQNLQERILEIEDKLQAWRTGIDEWRDAKEYMATVKVTTAQTNWFIEQFIPSPDKLLISDTVKNNIESARVELIGELFHDYNRGIMGTALGLFEAASSYEGWVREAHTPMTRFKRAMLSPTNVLSQARELALEAANA
jgi:phage/plasmid-like protein (TIGR03299 family)